MNPYCKYCQNYSTDNTASIANNTFGHSTYAINYTKTCSVLTNIHAFSRPSLKSQRRDTLFEGLEGFVRQQTVCLLRHISV